MLNLVLDINGEKLEFKFGFSLFRKLSMHWGYDNLNDVFGRCALLSAIGDNLKTESLAVLADVVSMAVINEGVDTDVVMDAFFSDTTLLIKFTEAFAASFPKVNQDVNPESRKGAGAKKK